MTTKKVNKTEAAAPAVAPTAPATPQVPAKKSNTVLIVVLILVFFFVILPAITVFGLGWYAKKKINDVTKNGFSYNNGAVEVNTNSNQTWPSSMPSVVPKFNDGKISSSGRLGDAWTVSFSGVERTEALKYQTALSTAGFTLQEPADLGSLYTVAATKGDVTVNVVWNGGDENSMLLSVTKGVQLPTDTE